MRSTLTIWACILICWIDSPLHAADLNSPGADTWVPVVTNGFGMPTQNLEVSWLQNFNGYLYAAANGTVYAGLAKRGTGSDDAPVDGYLYLYEATNNATSLAQNTGAGNGFGDPHNRNIASLAEFGGYLYASINNPSNGGGLWRTPFNAGNNYDDTSWQRVLTGGIDDSLNYELHHLSADNGYLWLVTMGVAPTGFTTNSPDEVWRSADGVHWVQSNDAGFGELTNGVSRYPAITGFGAMEVFGGRNLGAGARVCATTARPPTPALAVTSGVATLCWSATATNLTLETSTNLLSTQAWTTVTNTPQTTNGLTQLQLNTTAGGRYFRLRR